MSWDYTLAFCLVLGFVFVFVLLVLLLFSFLPFPLSSDFFQNRKGLISPLTNSCTETEAVHLWLIRMRDQHMKTH